MKKFLAVVMALALCLTMVSAVAETNISWTSWALNEETLIPIYGGSADAFMEDNADVKVDYSVTWPYGDYLTQLEQAAVAGNAPYIAHVKAEWMPELMEMGILKDLTGYVSEEVLADYSEATINAVTYDGKLMAMPWFGNSYALYCNTDLMAKAGITEDPTTWDELIEDAYKIAALGDDIYGLCIPNSNGVEAGEGYNLLPMLWAFGADYRDAEGKLALDSETSVAAFAQLKKLIDDKVSTGVGYSFKDLRNMFGQGKIGFYWDLQATISAAATAAENEEEFYKNFKAIEIPGTKAYAINHFLVVFDNTPDEVMPAVGKYLEYFSDARVIDIFFKGGQGKVSGRASVNAKVFADVDATSATYVNAMTAANPLPIDNHFMEAERKIVDAMTALAQGTEAEEACEDLMDALEEMYED